MCTFEKLGCGLHNLKIKVQDDTDENFDLTPKEIRSQVEAGQSLKERGCF